VEEVVSHREHYRPTERFVRDIKNRYVQTNMMVAIGWDSHT